MGPPRTNGIRGAQRAGAHSHISRIKPAETDMAKTDFRTVDDYLTTMPPGTRALLDEVRAIIRAALPDADEVISYQIPTYKQDGIAVIHFAGWKKHFSLYPVGEALVEALPEAARYPLSKGTIRFPLDEAVPRGLIEKIVGLRREAAAREGKGRSGGTRRTGAGGA